MQFIQSPYVYSLVCYLELIISVEDREMLKCPQTGLSINCTAGNKTKVQQSDS